MQCCGVNESRPREPLGNYLTCTQRGADILIRQVADLLRNKPIAEIVIRGEVTSRNAGYTLVTRQIDGVGDDSGCGVRHSCPVSKNGHGIRDAERETATA